jgi:hypothetical protein
MLRETIMPARRSELATNADYQALVPQQQVYRQMIEAVAVIMAVFCAAIFVAFAVEAHLRAGGWLARIRAVNSMYRPDSRRTN